MSNASYIKSVLENAPFTVDFNPELAGWLLHDEGEEFCCAKCAARVMARGCWVFTGKKSSPVWADSPKPDLPCIGCEVK